MTLPLFGDPDAPAPGRPVKQPWEGPPAPMSVIRAKVTRCGCGDPIVFAMVDRPRKDTGARPMPVEVEPDPHGNIRLWTEGRTLRGKVLTKAQMEGRADLHKSHFAKPCPLAAAYRTRGRS